MDLPITALPPAGPLAGTEPLALVQGGATKQTTAGAIAALGGSVQLSSVQNTTSSTSLNIVGTNPMGLVRATLTVAFNSVTAPGTCALQIIADTDSAIDVAFNGPVNQWNSAAASKFTADSVLGGPPYQVQPIDSDVLTMDVCFPASGSTSMVGQVLFDGELVAGCNVYLTLQPVVTTSF